MTSTSVKDVSTAMKVFAPNVTGGKGNAVAASFQDIWNRQSGQTAQNKASDVSPSKSRRTSDTTEELQRGESLQQKDVNKTDRKENSFVCEVQPEELEGRSLEEVMEVLGTAAAELMQEIADVFGMSMEELKQLMTDMDMDALDVLDADRLSALLLEAGGAQDSLALLTDEELCSNFRLLLNSRQETVAEISEQLQVTPEELTQLVQEGNELLADVEAMAAVEDADTVEKPLITVETDRVQTENPEAAESTADTLTENAAVKTQPEQKNQTGSQEKHSDNTKDQGSNFLMQNLKADSFQPQVQQTAESASVWSENTRDIMNQIMDYMRVQLKADTSSLEMQLHPASLGTLQVNVASKGGVLTASFVTQNEAVKAVLESQMVQLKESFAEQGVRVEAIEVTVQTHQFERNLEQGRGRQQNEAERKSRPRRINLNGVSDVEEAEEMTQEEQLAADIMTASGSTVDYTA